MLSGVTVASTVDLYATSSLGGVTGNILNTSITLAKDKGINARIMPYGSCGESLKKFVETTGPAGIMISINQYRKSRLTKEVCILENFKNLQMSFISSVEYHLCRRTDNLLPADRPITVGLGEAFPSKFVLEQLNTNSSGRKFKIVTFKDAISALAAMINKDVDVVYGPTGATQTAIGLKSIDCEVEKTIGVAPGVTRHISNTLSVDFALITKNMDTAEHHRFQDSLSDLPKLMGRNNILINMSPNKSLVDAFYKKAKSIENLD